MMVGTSYLVALTFSGPVETDLTASDFSVVLSFNSLGSFLLGGEGQETETAGTAGFTISQDASISDVVLREGLLQVVVAGSPGQVADEEAGAGWLRRELLLFRGHG